MYSALCDFILALLPWRMIFNLQIKRNERIGIALALSMGVLAGITGVMKAVQGYMLIDVRSPNCNAVLEPCDTNHIHANASARL